tara:strand:+ start:2663 stop:3193 length:531 start_codon:yes stop_codon:yes gene_type:complete
MKKIYFAYGANTNKGAMRRRCPNAKPVGAGHIKGYKLKFNNVADIVPFPNKDSLMNQDVPCVIWEITEDCEKALDRFEGFPSLYRKVDVEGYMGENYFYENGSIPTKINGFVYKMNYSGFHTPSPYYVRGIRDGLKGFFTDHDMVDRHIDQAIITSFRQSEKFTVQPRMVGGKQWR